MEKLKSFFPFHVKKKLAEPKIPVEARVEIAAYLHNLSGAYTKVHKFNQGIAMANYDIVFLVETWFNSSMNSYSTYSCCQSRTILLAARIEFLNFFQ